MRPCSFDSRSGRLEARRRPPRSGCRSRRRASGRPGSKARAFGEAPKRSAGLGLAQIVSTTASVARVDDAEVVAGGVRADDVAAVGRDGEGRGVEVDEDLGQRRPAREVDDAHRPFAGDARRRVDPDLGAPSGRAGEVARRGPASAPVRNIGLASDQDDIVRGDADSKARKTQPSRGRSRKGGSRGCRRRRACGRRGRRPGRPGSPRRAAAPWRGQGGASGAGSRLPSTPTAKTLTLPVDVAEAEAAAVGRKDRPGVAQLALGVGLEDVLRGRPEGRGTPPPAADPLNDGRARRVQDDELGRLPGGEEAAVGERARAWGRSPGSATSGRPASGPG